MKKFFLLFFAIYVSTVCFSQTDEEMTPYESSRYSLAKETFTALLENISETDPIMAYFVIMKDDIDKCEDKYDLMIVMEETIYTLCGLGKLFKAEANYWYESPLIGSKKEADQIKLWSEIGKDYSKKREKIEEKKTKEDIEREKNRLKKKNMVNAIKKEIVEKFSAWAEKGEVEKTKHYNSRMKDCSVAAHSMFKSKKKNDIFQLYAIIFCLMLKFMLNW